MKGITEEQSSEILKGELDNLVQDQIYLNVDTGV
jgi:hypothetical protein